MLFISANAEIQENSIISRRPRIPFWILKTQVRVDRILCVYSMNSLLKQNKVAYGESKGPLKLQNVKKLGSLIQVSWNLQAELPNLCMKILNLAHFKETDQQHSYKSLIRNPP